MYFLELCQFSAADLGPRRRSVSEAVGGNPPETQLHLDSCSQEGYAVWKGEPCDGVAHSRSGSEGTFVSSSGRQ